jgi:transcriptional regulator with XRE-family HTH domain
MELMPPRKLSTLGALVRKKRGVRKLRETAGEIGIGPATLMRVENGRIPDLETFGKICNWLEIDPGSFLGFSAQTETKSTDAGSGEPPVLVTAHLRAEQTPEAATVNALARMILLAIKSQKRSEDVVET